MLSANIIIVYVCTQQLCICKITNENRVCFLVVQTSGLSAEVTASSSADLAEIEQIVKDRMVNFFEIFRNPSRVDRKRTYFFRTFYVYVCVCVFCAVVSLMITAHYFVYRNYYMWCTVENCVHGFYF